MRVGSKRETGRSGVAAYLVKQVKKAGGKIYKIKFEGVNGGPDYLVSIDQSLAFVETKSKTGKLSKVQLKLHCDFAENYIIINIVRTKEEVDELIERVANAKFNA